MEEGVVFNVDKKALSIDDKKQIRIDVFTLFKWGSGPEQSSVVREQERSSLRSFVEATPLLSHS